VTDALLWSAFVAFFVGALYFAWPRPPRWSPALFHHAVLANLHGGELEKAGASLGDWKARCDKVIPRGPRPPAAGWTGDPALLGPDHDPSVRIGAACTWLALGEGDAQALAALSRRLVDVRLAWIGPGAVPVPHVEGGEAASLADAAATLGARHHRLVLVLSGDATPTLAALREAPGLRDRLRAVVLVGAGIDPGFVATQLTQEAFDTELAQSIPWLVYREAGQPGLAEPPLPPSGRRAIAVHDLGELPVAWRDDPHLPRALASLLAALA